MNYLSILILVLLFYKNNYCTRPSKLYDTVFYIKDENNKPIKNAYIFIENINFNKSIKLKSNNKGCCKCKLYHCCKYNVTVKHNGYYDKSFCIIPFKNMEYEICLNKKHKNRLYGFISNNNDKKIRRALVVLYEVKEPNKYIPKHFTYTDFTGEYNFFNLPKGTYIIKAIK